MGLSSRTVVRRGFAAFGERVLGRNVVPVLAHQKIDAVLCGALLARLGDEDHVAIERHGGTLEQEQSHQPHGDVALVVDGSPPNDEAVAEGGGERIRFPAGAFNTDDISVAHDDDGPLCAVAFQAGNEVGARRIESENPIRNLFAVQNGPQIIDHSCLVAGWVAGVNLQQRAVISEEFGVNLAPVNGSRDGGRGADGEQAECKRSAADSSHHWLRIHAYFSTRKFPANKASTPEE